MRLRVTLTPRQRDGPQLLAAGHSVTRIACQLHRAPGTVKTHLARLYAASAPATASKPNCGPDWR